jgi:CO/xanthine dehydrogenase Mo-binding subunit
MSTLKTLGHATPRIDARKRVTGTATYTGDLHLPGMLYARVLRSPHPHARVRRVDVSKALALAGVKEIITRENCDVIWGSGDTRNKRYIFANPVRFAGDAVAAVAAVNRHVAEEATRLIEVEYEPLPFVLDAEEALKPGALEIQPGGDLSQTARANASRKPTAAATSKKRCARRTACSKTNTARSITTTRSSNRASASPGGTATSSPSSLPRRAFQTAIPTSRAI